MRKPLARRRWKLLLWSAAVLLPVSLAAEPASPPAPPAEAAAAAMLAAHSRPIALEQGRLRGQGAESLMRDLADVQVLALGEEHNNLHIPSITLALFEELHRRHGFNYFATEQDPVTMRAVSARPLRGDLGAIGAAARTEPFSFTFITDQELELLAGVGRLSSGRHRPVWGCEQAFGAGHILRRLEARARSPQARQFVRDLRQRAVAVEAQRDESISTHFVARTELKEDLAKLAAFFPRPDAETAFLIRALAMSSEIYGYYRAGDRQELPGYWSNSKVREEYMKEVCAAEYRAATAADGRPPKVLLKHGQWHIYEVSSPASITTLGTFFSQAARMNGAGYRSIAFTTTSYGGVNIWENKDRPEMRAFASVMKQPGWRLIDLRPFREYPNFRLLRTPLGEDMPARIALQRLVYGFDYLFLIGPAESGTYKRAGVAPAPAKAQ